MRRLLLRFVLLILLPAAAVTAGGWYWMKAQRFIATENAYVKAHLIQVSATVQGRVAEVLVVDHQLVEAGQILFQIDPEPYRIAHAGAVAKLAATRQEVEAMRAEYRQVQGEIAEAKTRTGYLQKQLERQSQLKERGVGIEQKYDEASQELGVARSRFAALSDKQEKIRANLGGDVNMPAEKHPMVMQAQSAVDRALFDLARVTVRAPVAGVLANIKLKAGEWVNIGAPLFGLLDTGSTWIEANLKETQLTHIQVGQRATIIADAYPDLVWRARVTSIGPTTGAEFSLLPPQNASGNWVKVVQRLPVRLELESPAQGTVAAATRLRAGMSVAVEIDTGREVDLAQVMRSAFARGSTQQQ
jgi:membrane fusion protein, multidrug efflux system